MMIRFSTERMQAVNSPRPRTGIATALMALLALAAPKLATAQAVTDKDLIGTWAIHDSTQYGFTFRPDSTVRYVGATPQGRAEVNGRWRLANDTLLVNQVQAKLNGRSANAKFAPRTVAVKDKKLTVTRTDNQQSTTYEHADSLTTPAAAPAPAAPAPTPSKP